MKGLEEDLEQREREDLFLKRTSLNISMIIISSVNLVKDIIDYVYLDAHKKEKNIDLD